ncbi:MAG: hypothetical protein ABIQ32_09680 [Sphingomicrobium sp.]
MSENLVWLLYLVAGGLAFAAVFHKRWPIALSMVAASTIVTLAWYAAVELGKKENEPAWINVDLAMNASFALIFAGAGAAVAMYVRMKKGGAQASDDQE